MRTLAVFSTGLGRPPDRDLLRMEAADEYPRASLLPTTLNADVLDERYLAGLPGFRRHLYGRIPDEVAQVAEAFLAGPRYDALVTWAERLSLPLAGLRRLRHQRVPHIAILGWISRPRKALLLKVVAQGIDRLVFGSSVQRDYAVNALGIPAHKTRWLGWFVDQKFFRPIGGPTDGDMICSVGREMRDYPTFIEAIRALDIPCHIAAGTYRGRVDSWVKAIDRAGPLPKHLSVGKKSLLELRALYARSRFVVVPLLPTDSDNGVTTILEALAMGKPVICSRTKGQVDVVEHGRTGLLVPPGDAPALRDAMRDLWDHPETAKRMGEEGRKRVELRHTVDKYVQALRGVVEETIEESRVSRA